MKITYYEDTSLNHYELKLVYHPKNKKMAKILGEYLIERLDLIEVFDELGNKYPISLLSIYYMESVDHKVFCYTEKDVYRIRGRSITELKDLLVDFDFFQINVKTLVNLKHICYYTKLSGCRREVTLDNGDHLVATRGYRDEFDGTLRSKKCLELLKRTRRKQAGDADKYL